MCMVNKGQHWSSTLPSTILTGTRRYLGKSVSGGWKLGELNLTKCLNIQQSNQPLVVDKFTSEVDPLSAPTETSGVATPRLTQSKPKEALLVSLVFISSAID